MRMAINTALCAFAFAPVVVAQPVEWRVQDGGNGHWYEAVFLGSSDCWDASRLMAENRGAQLCTITSPQENAFVASLALQFVGNNVTLGGYKDLATDSWKWLSDEPFAFTSWQSGEPGCCAPNEYWLDMNASSGQWRDRQQCVAAPDQAHPGIAIVEYATGTDCNGDGIFDAVQFASGQLFDANHNGVADTCGITVQPFDQSVSVNVPVAFFVEITPAPACPAPVAFRWQRRDPSVHDANAPNAWIDLADAGAFLNSGTAGLLITHPIPGLATGYRCKLTGGCGRETTYTNVVNFSVACPADFNADGAVDFFDYDDFVRAFEAGC